MLGGAPNRVIGRDVQLDELGADCVGGSTTTLRVTRTEIHAMPGADKSTYRLETDSLVGSGDQAHRAGSQRCGHRKPLLGHRLLIIMTTDNQLTRRSA